MIERLAMFMVLARHEHFGRAAEELGITQPSLSSSLKALEDQLGVQLVRRGSRYRGLTPEGERVLDWARRIVGDARTMQAELRARRTGVTGRLRLGVIPTAMPRIAGLTAPFLIRYPGAEVAILSRSSDEIRDQIAALELDAGVTYLDGTAPGRVQTVPLFTENLCLVDRSAETGPASWAEAATRPLCLLTPDMQNRRIVAAELAKAGSPVAPRVESNSMLAILSHVTTGAWAAILPKALAEGLPLPRGVTARPLTGGTGHVVGLVAAEREPQPPLIEALFQVARSVDDDSFRLS